MSENQNSSITGENRFNNILSGISRYYPVFLAAFIAAAVTGIFPGYDIWFHIKNGEYILLNHTIPHKDVFLSSTPFLPFHYFTNYEWLFGVISFLIFKNTGLAGIHIFRTIIILAAIGAVYAASLKSVDRQEKLWGDLLIPSLLLLTFMASFSRFEPRPQIVSALCLALFSLILRGRVNKSAPIAVFFISLVWANCHIEILAGLVFIILVLFEKLASYKLSGKKELNTGCDESEQKNDLKYLLYSLGAAVAGFILSPTARGGLFQLADYYSRRDVLMYSGELTPLDNYFTSPYGILFILGIISFAAVSFRNRSRSRLSALLVFLPFGLLPFFNSRHVLAASMVIAPIIAGNLAAVFSGILSGSKVQVRNAVMIVLTLIFPVMLLSLWSTFIVEKPEPVIIAAQEPDLSKIRQNPNSLYPDGAIRFLNRMGLDGNIFCPFHWGNFIIFYENPYKMKNGGQIERKPFIDGMLQTYDNKLMKDYISMLQGQDRDRIIEQYGIDIFVLPYPQSKEDSFLELGQYLRNNTNWNLIYWDDVTVIYVKTNKVQGRNDIPSYRCINPGLAHLLGGGRDPQESEAFMADLENSIKTTNGAGVSKNYVWKGIMLFKRGDIDGAVDSLEKGKQINPKSVNIIFNLAIANLKKGNTEQGKSYLQECLRLNPGFRQASDLLRQFR
ncbi:MAG: hypothetical protein LWY06_08535 [Firmicutes bacterium]|nr:hypothetical protein [Bacillota bacterium]